MQTETTIIIAGLIIGWIATALYLIKAIQKAHARGIAKGLHAQKDLHAQEVQGLRQDIQNQIKLRHAANARRKSACTFADHELLTNVATTLRLALETWQAFPGTETMAAKVSQQQRELIAFAAKMWVSAYPEQPEAEDALANAPSLDTQLIEFLNTKGDLWGDFESSTVTFPHDANPDGYPHLRDALREAFEQEELRLQREFSGEDAA